MTTAMPRRAAWLRRLVTNRVGLRALLWAKLPLAAFAGLRIRRLDEAGCEVLLPAGWKTQNPFRSTYFAAQAMAAELSTGVPVLWLIEQSGAPIASLVTGLAATFTKKATSQTAFLFAGGEELKAAIARAAAGSAPVVFTARSVGTQEDGTRVAEVEITWSFKRRGG